MQLQLIRKFLSYFFGFKKNHDPSTVNKNNTLKVITIFTLLITFVPIAEAKQCLQIFAYKKEKPIEVHSRQLTIWRYGGQKDFSSASHSVWKNEGDSYSLKTLGIAHHHDYFHRGSSLKYAFEAAPEAMKNPGRTELESQAPGNNFLDKNQYLSISMQKTTSIDEKMIEEQFEISKSLTPTQVTFFENTAVMRKSDILRKFGKIPETARKDADANSWLDYLSHFDLSLVGKKNISPNRNIYYEVKEGTSWLISGQDPYNKKLQMPFEKAQMEVAYERDQFPFAWELGRAAATTPEGLGETLKAAAYFAYKELVILGGSLDKAFLFVHSATPLHTRLYKSVYKMQVYSKTNIKDETVLIAPLQTLLDISPPTQFARNLQLLHEAAPTLKPQDTVWAEQIATEKRNFFLENTNGSVVTVRDFSDLAFWRAVRIGI